jgi:hypothetical protein
MSTTTSADRSPFPHQGTFSLEARDPDTAGNVVLPPTLVLPAVKELDSYARVYLERFGTPGPQIGQAVAICGPHGTGKTHAVGYVLGQVAEAGPSASPGARDVLQLYAKAEEPDLVGLYRTLMPQIRQTTLGEITRRFTATIAADSLEASDGDPELARSARERLVARPQALRGLLREYVVDESDLLMRRDEQIELYTGGSIDFVHAVRWLDTELGEIAYRWLVGRTLAAPDLRRLGVSGSIDSAKMAKYGLQLLAAMCQRAGTALIIYLDQFEKLVLDAGGDLDRDAAGLLHTLVEVLPRQDAMLVLGGSDRAWDALPPDLKQRFAFRVIESRGLELEEAAALVHLYLRPRDAALVDREVSEAELHPFTRDALRLVHLYSRGNARRFLQLCSAAYDAAGGGRIDAEVARKAAEGSGVSHVDPQSALAEARTLAEARGFTAVEITGGLRLVYEGSDRVLVLVGQSTHYYDEVLNAREHLDEIERLRRSAPGTHAVLVVLGYDSPEVRTTLERAGIEVLSYQPDSFAESFGTTLDEARRTAGDGAAREMRDGLANELEQLRSELERLRLEREADAQGLLAQATAVEAYQDKEQLSARWQRAANDWVPERRRLEEAIRDVRQARRAAELDELNRLREHAERERTGRKRLLWLAFVAVVLLGIATAVANSSSNTSLVLVFGVSLFLAVIAVASWLFWQQLRNGLWGLRDELWRNPLQGELAVPVGSVEDLRRLAYRASSQRPNFRFFARHPNPQFRYAAAAAASRPHELHELGRAVPGERSALVRRAFALRLAHYGDPMMISDAAYGAVLGETREAAYLFEVLLSGAHPLGAAPSRMPAWFDTLRAMVERQDVPPAARALAAAVPDDYVVYTLGAALAAGLPFATRRELMELPIERLRDSARRLSPFEEGGLGTFDELGIIADVDAAFLGISQILFLSEFGLLIESG